MFYDSRPPSGDISDGQARELDTTRAGIRGAVRRTAIVAACVVAFAAFATLVSLCAPGCTPAGQRVAIRAADAVVESCERRLVIQRSEIVEIVCLSEEQAALFLRGIMIDRLDAGASDAR